jgi:octaprenyl-diphosphate synthase
MYIQDKFLQTKIIGCIQQELELFEKEYKKQFMVDDATMQPILDYIAQKSGKRIRPVLFFLSQGLLGKPVSESVLLAVMIELLHTASLIHDDVVDSSQQRRGADTLNAVWDNKISVLLGDYLLAKVLQIGVSLQYEGVMDLLSDVVIRMGKGELQHIIKNEDESLSVQEYLSIVRNKTAGLFSAACVLGGMAVSASPVQKKRFNHLGKSIGISFQIRDDILDLNGSLRQMGKPAGQDLFNGTITLPLICAVQEARARGETIRYSDIKSQFLMEENWLFKFLDRFKGIEMAQRQAKQFTDEALRILQQFKPSIYREALEELIHYDRVRVE